MTMKVASLFALFIGMFIIYNSFAIAVTQRRAEIGILRALGATRGQIRALFLGESAVAGLAGSAVGIGFGLLMAHGMDSQRNVIRWKRPWGSRPARTIFWCSPGCWRWPPRWACLTSMIAAFLPARNAARVDPVQALQKGKYQVLSAGENRRRKIAAAAAVVLALICLAIRKVAAGFLYGLFPGHAGGAAADAGAGAVSRQGFAAAAEVAAPGGRRAGRR